MANVFEFDGFVPVIHESAFVHPNATVTGNVTIGRDVYVGPGAAIRGDWGGIVIEDGCNVQESCTVHMFPGVTVVLEAGAHVGHGAVVHGCTIEDGCLIGMGATILNRAVIGAGTLVAAGAVVLEDTVVPPGSLVAGVPAKVRRELTEEELAGIRRNADTYVDLSRAYLGEAAADGSAGADRG